LDLLRGSSSPQAGRQTDRQTRNVMMKIMMLEKNEVNAKIAERERERERVSESKKQLSIVFSLLN
jgi:hypothetical protein